MSTRVEEMQTRVSAVETQMKRTSAKETNEHESAECGKNEWTYEHWVQ